MPSAQTVSFRFCLAFMKCSTITGDRRSSSALRYGAVFVAIRLSLEISALWSALILGSRLGFVYACHA